MDNNDSYKTSSPPVSLSSATPTTEQLLPNETTVFSSMDVQSTSITHANLAQLNGNQSSSAYENQQPDDNGPFAEQSMITDDLDHQEFDSEIELKIDTTKSVEEVLDEIPRLCQTASLEDCVSEDDDSSYSDDSDAHSVIYVPTSASTTTTTSPFKISPTQCDPINGDGVENNDENGRIVEHFGNDDEDEEEIYYQNDETLKQKKPHSHLLTNSQAILDQIIQQKNADSGDSAPADEQSSSMLHSNNDLNDVTDNGHTTSILTNISNSNPTVGQHEQQQQQQSSTLKNLLTTFTINHVEPVQQPQQSNSLFDDSPFQHQYKFVDITPSEISEANNSNASSRSNFDDYDDDEDDDRSFRPSNSNAAQKHNLGAFFTFSGNSSRDSNNIVQTNNDHNSSSSSSISASPTTSSMVSTFGASSFTFEPESNCLSISGGSSNFYRNFYQQQQRQQQRINTANDASRSNSSSLSSTSTSTTPMLTGGQTISTTKINGTVAATVSIANVNHLNLDSSSLFSAFDPLRDMAEMETSLIENNSNLNLNTNINFNINNSMQQHQILMQQQQQHHYAITPNVVIVGNSSSSSSNNNSSNHHHHHRRPLNGAIKPITMLGGEGHPYVMLTRKENSCPFMDRRISLVKDCKIGRSIGKTRPSADNAVFDCKVLSRNHALLWYQDGKFFLKDNCSSNGTFVNNQRLSTANEKSLPHVLYSGDVIQFGVEVTEKKNVHSCVIATVRLFHPDGTEARKDYSSLRNGLAMDLFEEHQFQNYPDTNITITPSQLIDLSFYLKESVRKQALLESQLNSMKQVVKEALMHAKYGWNSLVDEDLLMDRIQTLESQLEVCLIAKNKDQRPVDDVVEALKQETLQLIEDKGKFERTTKRSLQKALHEKNTIETSLQTAQAELNAKTEECNMLKESLNLNVKEMKTLVNNCDKLKQENDELQAKINSKAFNDDADLAMAKFLSANLSDSVSDPWKPKIDQEIQTVANEFMSPELSPFFWDARDNIQDKETQTIRLTTIDQPEAENIEKTFPVLCSGKDSDDDSIVSFKVKNFQEHMKKLATENVEFGQHCLATLANILQMLEEKSDQLVKIQKNFGNIQQLIPQMANLIGKERAENRDLNKKMDDLQRKLYEQMEECNKFECDMDIMNKKIIEYKLLEKEFVNKKLNDQPVKDVAIQTDQNDGDGQPKVKEEEFIPKNHKLVVETGSLAIVKRCDHCSIFEQVLKTMDAIQLDDQKYLKKNGTINHCHQSSVINDGDRQRNERKRFEISTGYPETCDNDQHSKLNKQLAIKLKEFSELNHRILVLNENLENEIKNLKNKYAWLSQQNEVSFCIAVLPLFIIIIAVIFALYSPLSYITGTFGL